MNLVEQQTTARQPVSFSWRSIKKKRGDGNQVYIYKEQLFKGTIFEILDPERTKIVSMALCKQPITAGWVVCS